MTLPEKCVTVIPVPGKRVSTSKIEQFGIQDVPTSCSLHDEQSFHLYWTEATSETDIELLECTVLDSDNEVVFVDMIRLRHGYEVLFTPTDCGQHHLSIKV